MQERLDPEVLAALLGLIAHDLRNPLSALQSNVGFVRSVIADADQDVNDALFDAQTACHGVVEIVDNMEILSHVLRGSPSIELSSMAVAAVVEDVVQRLGPTAKSHDTTIVLEGVDERRDLNVLSQREMLARAISNLVRNGIQHGGRGPVRVSLAGDSKRCTVRVEDRGAPIADELAVDAFTASGQLTAKNARGGRYGRGLGLFCARVAAEAVSATVRSRDAAGGSVLELSLPLAPSA